MKAEHATDAQTTVNALREEVGEFVNERDWSRYHSPKNLAMSIAIEAAEIMEHFQWHSGEQSLERLRNDAAKAQIADELADVFIYCLCLANVAGIDISTAVRSKLEHNRERYPVGTMPEL